MTCMSVIDDEILACVRGCYGAVRVRDLNLTRTERRHLKRLVEARAASRPRRQRPARKDRKATSNYIVRSEERR